MRRVAVMTGVLSLCVLACVAAAGCSAGGRGAAVQDGYGVAPDLAGLQPGPGLTLLKLKAFQQTTEYTCGPCTLKTLLNFYGRDGDEMKLASQAGCTEEKGTDPKHMAVWLKKNGFDVQWGENGSLAMLRENLAKGIPTIVEWIDWGGHWVTVVGYDTRQTASEDDDIIIFADSVDCHDGRVDGLTCFNASRFDYMWFDAFLFDKPMHKVYIVARPHNYEAKVVSSSRP